MLGKTPRYWYRACWHRDEVAQVGQWGGDCESVDYENDVFDLLPRTCGGRRQHFTFSKIMGKCISRFAPSLQLQLCRIASSDQCEATGC